MAKSSEISEFQYEYSRISTSKPVKHRKRRSIKGLIATLMICAMSLAAAGLMIK